MQADQDRARVFLGCAQGPGQELQTAQEIAHLLQTLGFEVYMAKQQESLEGVKEAIFPQLATSEYFLFIDFPREQIDQNLCRGSLFSHQELAIAAYLEMPFLGFRDERVKSEEGISGFVLANVDTFANPIELPQKVRDALQRHGWSPGWKNRLRLSRERDEYDDMRTTVRTPDVLYDKPVRFFHLRVANQHQRKMALNCVAYVETMVDADTRQELEFRPAELKWAGSTLPVVPIMPGRSRDLDACFIFNDNPQTVFFRSFSDSGKHMGPIDGKSRLDIGYIVVSENFPPARCRLRIEPAASIDGVQVYQLD
jgi:hypothetical protein